MGGMSVYLSSPVEGLTLADLYRIVDLARGSDLDPATPVRLSGQGPTATLRVDLDRPAASADLSGTVGEVVGFVDELRRRFSGPSAS